MRWNEEHVRDGTGEDVARSAPTEAALHAAGFAELGVLTFESPGLQEGKVTTRRVPVWRSFDGAAAALAGPDAEGGLVLLSLLQDGTVVRTTRWRWPKRPDVPGLLEAHRQKLVAATSRPVPLDLPDTAAAHRRWRHVTLAPGEWAARSPVPFLAPLAAAVAIVVALRLVHPLPTLPDGSIDVLAARQIARPDLLRSAGLLAGAFTGAALGTREAVVILMTALMGGSAFVSLSHGPFAGLVAPETLGWSLVGLALVLAWSTLGAPIVSARLAERPPELDGAGVLRLYAPLAEPVSGPPPGWFDDPAVDRLRQAGFTPLGPRVCTDGHRAVRAELLADATGTTIAEVRGLDGGGVHVAFTSLVGLTTIVETRTLPDPGPLPDRVDRGLYAKGLDTTVTASALRLARCWPTPATVRLADRPRRGLRVHHAASIDEALAQHAFAGSGARLAAARTLEDATRVLDDADRRRAPRKLWRTEGPFAAATLVAVPLVIAGTVIGLMSRGRDDVLVASLWGLMAWGAVTSAEQPSGSNRRQLGFSFVWPFFLMFQGSVLRFPFMDPAAALAGAVSALVGLRLWRAWQVRGPLRLLA